LTLLSVGPIPHRVGCADLDELRQRWHRHGADIIARYPRLWRSDRDAFRVLGIPEGAPPPARIPRPGRRSC